MARKVGGRRVGELRRCPWCGRDVKRMVVAGDEREEVVAYVCSSCRRDIERIEKRDAEGGRSEHSGG